MSKKLVFKSVIYQDAHSTVSTVGRLTGGVPWIFNFVFVVDDRSGVEKKDIRSLLLQVVVY